MLRFKVKATSPYMQHDPVEVQRRLNTSLPGAENIAVGLGADLAHILTLDMAGAQASAEASDPVQTRTVVQAIANLGMYVTEVTVTEVLTRWAEGAAAGAGVGLLGPSLAGRPELAPISTVFSALVGAAIGQLVTYEAGVLKGSRAYGTLWLRSQAQAQPWPRFI